MEIVTGTVTGFIVEAIKQTFEPIKRHVCYFFNHESKVRFLKDQLEKLTDARENVQHRADDATRNGEEIKQEVLKWLTSVQKKISEDAEELRRDEEKAKKRCFLRLCPDFMSRYHLSKKAEKEANIVVQLLNEANKYQINQISYRPDPQLTVAKSAQGFESFQSREVLLERILEALKDPTIQRIGVYGMGGVGKTMLVKEVAFIAKKDNLFDEVAIATISNSQKTDIRKAQGEIADALGLKFDQETESGRANRLRQRLNNGRKILVILDDIWAKVDLQEAGIIFEQKQDMIGCKLLLTSRNRDTLSKLMNIEKSFEVRVLSEEEAMTLFAKIVGSDKLEQPGYMPSATHLVSKCAGLPIVISAIATALKDMTIDIWEDALLQLQRSNPTNIEEMQEGVFPTLELSYRYLKNYEAQLLFLLCSLEPQGQDISVSNLIKCMWGMGWLNRVYTMKEARQNVTALVHKLRASSLLLNGDTDIFVKMHDIVRDVSVSIASKDKHMLVVEEGARMQELLRKGELKSCTALSIPYIDSHALPSVLDCPQLELLLFFSKDEFLEVPDAFFQESNQLKVLNLTGMNFPSVPASFTFLTNLQTLSLHKCTLQDIAIIGELQSLEVLSFSESKIKELPMEIAKLSNLKSLDLSDCSELNVIPRNLISSLKCLEELYLENSFYGWDLEGNARVTELTHLSHLSALDTHILDAQIIPINFFSENLDRYQIFIGNVWSWYAEHERSRILRLHELNANMHLDHGLEMLLKKTEELCLHDVRGVMNVLSKLDGAKISHLKDLLIEECSEIQYLVNSLDGILAVAFPTLESLSLIDLMNLEKICNGKVRVGSFNGLKVLRVKRCGNMKNLLSSSMVRELRQLQEIEAYDCENIVEIVDLRDDNTNDKLEFCSLRTLELRDLGKLINFCNERKHSNCEDLIGKIIEASPLSLPLFNHEAMLCYLEVLRLIEVNVPRIWDDTSCIWFKNLTSLTIWSCHNLKNVFSSTAVARCLVQLKHLEVFGCESMIEIIVTDKVEIGDGTLFLYLDSLHLTNLPKLKRFCENSIELSSLRELLIINCSALMSFVSNTTTMETLVEGEVIKNNSDKNEGSDTRIYLFDKKVSLPKLEILKIHDLKNFRRIWDKQLAFGSFNNLNSFTLCYCDRLLSIFPIKMLERLQKLLSLDIYSCSSVEEIFEHVEPSLGKLIASKFELPRITNISLTCLPKLKSFSPKIIDCPSLRRMQLFDCDLMEFVFASENISFKKSQEEEESNQQLLFWGDTITFSNLEELCLCDNKNLKGIWREQLPSQCLSHLKVLEISYGSIVNTEVQRNLLCNSFLSLPSIEKLDIYGVSLKEIFGGEGSEVVLPIAQLSDLKLDHLDELRCLWDENLEPFGQVFNKLITLQVSSCGKLKNLLVPSSVSFSNLVTLSIDKCSGLINLLTHSTAKSLVQLKRMEIVDCGKMQGIIAKNEAKDDVLFTHLKYLKLSDLPNLQGFCLGNCTFQFPSLDELIVTKCPKLKIFSEGALSTPKLRRVHLSKGDIGERLWFVIEGDLNNSIQHIQKMKMNVDFLDLSALLEILDSGSPQERLDFKNITRLELCNCARNSLRYLLTPSMVLCLACLWNIKVENCTMIEQVICEDTNGTVLVKIVLPWLSELVIKSCSNLSSFCTGSYDFKCPFLSRLVVADCPKMITFLKEQEKKEINEESEDYNLDNEAKIEAFFSHKVYFPQLSLLKLSSLNIQKIRPDALPSLSSLTYKLQSLVIQRCDRLKHLMPTSMVNCFQYLQSLKICHCEMLESVIATKEDETMWQTFFDNLQNLELKGLPKLMSFCTISASGNFALFDQRVSFPYLRRMKISHLNNIKVIYSEKLLDISGPQELIIEDCHSLEEIFEVQVLNLKEKHVMERRLERLHLSHLPNLKQLWNNDSQITFTFENLRSICLRTCWNLRHIFPMSVAKGLVRLEEVDISSCGIEEFVSEEEETLELAKFVFPELTTMKLWEVPKLKCFFPRRMHQILECPKLKTLDTFHCGKVKIFTSKQLNHIQEIHEEGQHEMLYHKLPLFSIEKMIPALQALSLSSHHISSQLFSARLFHVIKILDVQCYHDHSAVFPFRFLQRFHNLQELVVRCSKFKKIFPCKGDIKEENYMGTLSKVRRFRLFKLDDLRQIWKDDFWNDLILKNLGTLEVWDCDSLTCLAPSWASFQNLTFLHVRNCNGLVNIFATETCQSLVRLTKMCIADCFMVTEIVANEEDELTFCEITFNWLEHLELDCLPSITSFSSGNHTYNFPSLDTLIVKQCPELKIFSHGVLKTPLLESVQQIADEEENQNPWYEYGDNRENDGLWAGDLNSTIQQIYTTKDGYQGMKYMDFYRFPQLMYIWNRNQQETLEFKSLERLEVCNFNNFRYLFSLSMALSLGQLRVMTVRNCSTIEQVIIREGLDGSVPKEKILILLPLLGSVSIESCPDLKCFYQGRDTLKCLSLNRISVIDCPKLITFVSLLSSDQSEERQRLSKGETDIHAGSFFTDKALLPNLVYLKLSSINIQKIWDERKLPTMSSCVHHLTELIVEGCGNLRYLFRSSLVKSCTQLETLEIRDCKLLNGVIFTEDLAEDETITSRPTTSSSGNHFEFPFLRELVIENCPLLETFISNSLSRDATVANLSALWDEKVTFPSLEILKLQRVAAKAIWQRQYPMANSLVQLTRMNITDCKMIREIITCVPDGAREDGIVFCQLKYLELVCLPNLESFCSGKWSFGFPSLEEVTVTGCPIMRTFSQGEIRAPKLRRLKFEGEEEELCEGSSNTTIQNCFLPKMSSDSKED